MTELQPTEVELTGKNKNVFSVSKRKVVFFAVALIIIALATGLTAILANRASKPPESTERLMIEESTLGE